MRRIVTFGLCALALPMLAAGQTKDDFEFWEAMVENIPRHVVLAQVRDQQLAAQERRVADEDVGPRPLRLEAVRRQRLMRDAERRTSPRSSRNEGWLTVLDGPLHGIRHRRVALPSRFAESRRRLHPTRGRHCPAARAHAGSIRPAGAIAGLFPKRRPPPVGLAAGPADRNMLCCPETRARRGRAGRVSRRFRASFIQVSHPGRQAFFPALRAQQPPDGPRRT